jgi:hypothetical protein
MLIISFIASLSSFIYSPYLFQFSYHSLLLSVSLLHHITAPSKPPTMHYNQNSTDWKRAAISKSAVSYSNWLTWLTRRRRVFLLVKAYVVVILFLTFFFVSSCLYLIFLSFLLTYHNAFRPVFSLPSLLRPSFLSSSLPSFLSSPFLPSCRLPYFPSLLPL